MMKTSIVSGEMDGTVWLSGEVDGTVWLSGEVDGTVWLSALGFWHAVFGTSRSWGQEITQIYTG
jgi:hypothetical protein